MATTPVDSIAPENDPRVKHCYEDLNGRKYHYLLCVPPSGQFEQTIFLIHGWPDLSLGWRNQIPALLEMGFRVVAPDVMGYGRTDAPPVPPAESIKFYTFKRIADDLKTLANKLGCEKIFLGGHDWGGAIVYRIALWHPELISAIFAVCTPYRPPTRTNVSLEDMVKTQLPNFTYQIELASGEVEKHIVTKQQIKEFLNGLYGGSTPDGLFGFDVTKGVLFDNLPKLQRTKLMSDEMLDWYAEEYARNGIHGSLNWYRNRDQNFEEELQLHRENIEVPVLFIQATKDAALPPWMSEGMEKYCPHLTRKSVETTHWALWQAPASVNEIVREWWEEIAKSRSHL